MGLQRYFAEQLRRPSGWFGSLVVSRLMNAGNRRIMKTTVNLLQIDAMTTG